MSIRVSNIQHFSLHDGPGIRTTVFLKGCSLHCPWCCNPENISKDYSYFFDNKKCIAYKGKCFINNNCEVLQGSNQIKKINNNCPTIEIIGKDYTNNEIISEIIKDIDYFGKDGGVTFSGGEPFLQSQDLIPVLKVLKKKKINICFETSLFVPISNIKNLLEYIDYLYIDAKNLIPNEAKKNIGLDVDTYLNNLNYVASHFNINNITIRIPIVRKFTSSNKNIDIIAKTLEKNKIKNVEIFSVHNLAKDKYSKLNINYCMFDIISDIELLEIKEKLICYHLNVKILNL